jgi:hypothetical protein
MSILVFSAFLMIVILLIRYFYDSSKLDNLKIVTIFGFCIGTFALIINYWIVSNNCFSASTPISIKTKNLTNEEVKIFVATFWKNEWEENGSHFYYNETLRPNEVSDFCFDNDSGENFWIIGKTNDQIIYLNKIKPSKIDSIFVIHPNEKIDFNVIEFINSNVYKTERVFDSKNKIEWLNIVLLMILGFAILKIKKQ